MNAAIDDPAPVATSIAVCACTYKRPDGLRMLLGGLAGQTFAAFHRAHGYIPRVDIIITDNEGSDEARRICAAFPCHERMSVVYVGEPRRGISFARNACLRNIPDRCRFFAMIDDDGVPAPDWLDQLLAAQAATHASVVQGRVVPAFAARTPEWIVVGGFFGTPRRLYDLDAPERTDLQDLEYAATNNVLVRVDSVRDAELQFDPDFALSGGEDTLFFLMLRARGARIVYAERAVVHDRVPANRACLRYLVLERFRMANTNEFVAAKAGGNAHLPRLAGLLNGAEHIALAMRRIVKNMAPGKWSADRFAVGAFHAAFGLGIIAAAFGFRYQHYK